MLTISDIRLQNLEKLIEQLGGRASTLCAIASERGVEISDVYISQIRNRTPVRRKGGAVGPPRSMGDELARQIEHALALERGWMDNVHVANDALEGQLLDLYRSMSFEGKHELLRKANERYNHEHPRVPSQANPFPRLRTVTDD